ncbi:hypothetical protein TREES_T100002909 [Tupaia chinensis]|uniref:Uncharacterized protein n=1 Tax=Tupaia chinensis TaxID=246437 RepID=L9KTB0_TUPCH|nr:hypothetical protein TREES_T100002909 [Tupaia chinensis]
MTLGLRSIRGHGQLVPNSSYRACCPNAKLEAQLVEAGSDSRPPGVGWQSAKETQEVGTSDSTLFSYIFRFLKTKDREDHYAHLTDEGYRGSYPDDALPEGTSTIVSA